jgi:hypothetical protein
MNKRAFLENLTPEQRGALIGSMVGAGGLGLTTALGSKKNKMRNALLAALAGGAGGAGLGYFAPGLLGQGAPKEPAGPAAPEPGEREMAEGLAARDSAMKGIKDTIGQTNKRLADEQAPILSNASKSDISGLSDAPKSSPDLSALLPAGKLLKPQSTIDALTSSAPDSDPTGGMSGNLNKLLGNKVDTVPSGAGLGLSALLGTVGAAGAIGGKYKGMADRAKAVAESAKPNPAVTPFAPSQQSVAPAGARGKNVSETPEAAKARTEAEAGAARAANRGRPTTVQRDAQGNITGMEDKYESYKTKGPQLGDGLPKRVGGGGFGAPVPLDDVQKNILGQMGLGKLPGLAGR